MANILILKRRIRTAQNVSKTTKAMQMIAASKLKKAQDAALSSRPYTQSLTSLLQRAISKTDEEDKNVYMRRSENNKALIILISPDKGLCGGLITNLTRDVVGINPDKNTKFIAVGKKAESIVSKVGSEMIASFSFGTTLPAFYSVYPIIRIANDQFVSNEVSSIKIIHTEFSTIFSQKPKTLNLLPIEIAEEIGENLMIFEPSLEEILPSLIKKYFEMRLYQTFLESYLSEQAARMLAMQNATDNALEIIEELKLDYNKQRQEKITSEILDIGGGGAFIYE